MTLFIERGYDEVTVADIAQRAGLTKRTFFNHFADKREVIFAFAGEFEARIVGALAGTDPGLDPLAAVARAYTQGAAMIVEYPELVRAREALVASSQELQERDQMKMASLTAKVAAVLVDRGVSPREAMFVAQAGASIFTTAIADWAADPALGLEQVMQGALNDFRAAVGS
ncbi:MAG: TetR/AcrR family transcriptional regulator [Solirubrobacteraceae bacterium]